jgi:ankyrin repeat protein
LNGTGLLVSLALLKWADLADRYLDSPTFRDLSRTEKIRIWTESFKLKDRERETVLGYCLRERQVNFIQLFIRHGASFDQESEALYTAMRAFEEYETTGERTLKALTMLVNAGASTNPMPSNTAARAAKRFAFTPLQLAVYKLEYEWVELLLEEGADVNNIGKLGGIIPSSFDDPDQESDDLNALKDMGQHTPLEICAWADPTWAAKANAESLKHARQSIEELLKRYGAKDVDEEGEEEQMAEDVPAPNTDMDKPETIDLTMASDNGFGDWNGPEYQNNATTDSLTAAQANPGFFKH